MAELNPVYQKISAQLRGEDFEFLPRVLSLIMKPDQAEILLTLPAADVTEIATKLKRDPANVEKDVKELAEKGLVLYRKKGGLRSFYSLTELKDTTLSNPKFDKEYGHKFFDLWDEFFDSDEFARWWYTLPLDENQTIPLMRVIPKWQALQGVDGVLPCDDVSQMLKEKQDTLGINHCSCRRVSYRHCEPDIPEEICFTFDEVTDYCVQRGTGRRISYDEAIALTNELNKYNLVHLCYNDKRPLRLIGNCGPYCITFRLAGKYSITNCAPTRFHAEVDTEKCHRGEECLKRCLFDAIDVRYDPELERKRAFIDPVKCLGCGNCVLHCPEQAIKLVVDKPPEFIPDKYTGIY
jgi:ferredoxin